MATVRIIQKSTVRPENPTEPTTRIELTPWDLDLLPLEYIQKGLLFRRPSPEGSHGGADAVAAKLKASLSRTLDHFFPLAGRLATTVHDDGSASFFVDCNGAGAGAQYIHAAADGITAADILDSVYTPLIVNSFFPLNGVLGYEGTSKPLLGVQVTELADAGIFVGCSFNHTLGDGTSFWNFFNSWSEIARTSSSGQISRPPILRRWFLEDSSCPIRIQNYPCPEKNPSARFVSPVPLRDRVFNFRKEKIQALKDRANSEKGTTRVSSFQALLAHLWRSVARSRQHDPDEETTYRVIIGARRRLNPPIPDTYFGNAVVTGVARVKAGDLTEGLGLGFGAAEINRMVASQTEEEMRGFLRRWAEEPKLMEMEGFWSNSLITGSSTRFDVYGNDFGWGRPAAVRSGVGNKFDGKLTVFEGAEEGSVDVEACLRPGTLEAMAGDAEFMEAVTVPV